MTCTEVPQRSWPMRRNSLLRFHEKLPNIDWNSEAPGSILLLLQPYAVRIEALQSNACQALLFIFQIPFQGLLVCMKHLNFLGILAVFWTGAKLCRKCSEIAKTVIDMDFNNAYIVYLKMSEVHGRSSMFHKITASRKPRSWTCEVTFQLGLTQCSW